MTVTKTVGIIVITFLKIFPARSESNGVGAGGITSDGYGIGGGHGGYGGCSQYANYTSGTHYGSYKYAPYLWLINPKNN